MLRAPSQLLMTNLHHYFFQIKVLFRGYHSICLYPVLALNLLTNRFFGGLTAVSSRFHFQTRNGSQKIDRPVDSLTVKCHKSTCRQVKKTEISSAHEKGPLSEKNDTLFRGYPLRKEIREK
jgi:hypothetical protein